MDDPGGRPNFCILVGGDIFHQKIDQPALFLEQAKESHDLRFGLMRGWRGRLDRDGRRRRNGDWAGSDGAVLFPPVRDKIRTIAASTRASVAIGMM